LAVFKLHGLAVGQEGDLHGVFAGGVFGQGAGSLCLFFCHTCSLLCVLRVFRGQFKIFNHRGHTGHGGYSNSALAMGCGAVGPSPRSVSSMVLPFSAEDTAVSIISSARRIVPWL